MRPLAFVAIAALLAPAPVPALPLADGWEVHEAADFCYIWLGKPEAGGTELGLALDANERATLILANPSWQLEASRNYRLSAGIDGAFRVRKGRGLAIGSDRVALAAPLEEAGFVERFAASGSLRFEGMKVKAGPSLGSFTLAGAPAAVAALRQCLERQKGKAKDLARYKADRETTFRSDPNPSTDPGAPPTP